MCVSRYFYIFLPHLVELSFDSEALGHLAVRIDAIVQELRPGRHEGHPLSPRVVGDYGVGEALLSCLKSDERLRRRKRGTLNQDTTCTHQRIRVKLRLSLKDRDDSPGMVVEVVAISKVIIARCAIGRA